MFENKYSNYRKEAKLKNDYNFIQVVLDLQLAGQLLQYHTLYNLNNFIFAYPQTYLQQFEELRVWFLCQMVVL